MSEQEPVCVGTYPAETLAELAKMRLEANGIESFIASDDCGGMLPFLQSSRGVRLCVRESDAESAARILEAADEAPQA
jgi:hypothetical protein